MPENDEIARLESELEQVRNKLHEAKRKLFPHPVTDYIFTESSGTVVKLSELFGRPVARPGSDSNDSWSRDLIVIHNMGVSCAYCSLWADGFAGMYGHLSSRAAFVLATPDEPKVQRRLAAARHWPFRMVSTRGTTFFADMGFAGPKGEPWPGASGFRLLDGGAVVRTGKSVPFGPGDPFCPVWPLFDLLQDRDGGWKPPKNDLA